MKEKNVIIEDLLSNIVYGFFVNKFIFFVLYVINYLFFINILKLTLTEFYEFSLTIIKKLSS